MKEDKFNSFGVFTIINSLTSASLYGIFSSYVLTTSKNASPISITIGFIISLFISKIILSFFKKYPTLSFSEKGITYKNFASKCEAFFFYFC